MNIINPSTPDRMFADSGELVHCKIIPIPPWNMDSTAFIHIAHGLGALWEKLLSLTAVIRNDLNTYHYHASTNMYITAVDFLALGLERISPTEISISRTAGHFFDTADFSSIAFDRGKIIIWYTE